MPGLDRFRNFSIVAHVDHGKSTLADRILELTGAVDPRDMRAQYLDSMDLERERGITIKAQNVRLHWADHVLHLIDTPGHVDFGYEVSRSLAACEGALLLVDASQGIEAQTLANCYLALEHDLTIVAALNKIDLPAAEPDRVAGEIEHVLGIPADEILQISAKTGEGVPALLDALVARIPAPKGDADAPLQALIFDSIYDAYRGVVSSVRVFNGTLGQRCAPALRAGEGQSRRRGDRGAPPGADADRRARPRRGRATSSPASRTSARRASARPSPPPRTRPRSCRGTATRSRWCSAVSIPVDGDEYAELREALEKLRLNDSSFTYEPETSGALGFGFRCGFLGLLHMEIVRERLEREYDLSLVATAPNVEYQLELVDGTVEIVDNPSAMPTPNEIAHIEEPYVNVTVLTPTEYIGSIMELCQQRRGDMTRMEYLSEERVELVYVLPLAEIVMDFFDQLKSRTQGLREPRLRAHRLPRVEPVEGRRAAQQRRRRRLLDHRAPRPARTTTGSA